MENKNSSTMDGRNIVDRYWGWTEDLIKEDLNRIAFPYAVLMENFQHDFNIGSLMRAANAFGAKEFFYIGKKRFDKRGTVGTTHYNKINHLKDFNDLSLLKEKYTFIGIENNINSCIEIDDFEWPENPLLIFGEEGIGLTKEMMEICKYFVTIPQYGSVRSLNAAQAGAIACHDFVRKYNKKNKPMESSL